MPKPAINPVQDGLRLLVREFLLIRLAHLLCQKSGAGAPRLRQQSTWQCSSHVFERAGRDFGAEGESHGHFYASLEPAEESLDRITTARHINLQVALAQRCSEPAW